MKRMSADEKAFEADRTDAKIGQGMDGRRVISSASDFDEAV